MACVFTEQRIQEVNARRRAAAEPDEIKDFVHKIENLDKDDAIARVGQLEDAREQTYFELGGVLSRIYKNEWYDPHKSFDAWVEYETAMSRAKARALVEIYDALASCGAPWAQVKHLGWTKVRAIASLLNKETADHWIKIAGASSKSELIEQVKEYKAQSAAGGPQAVNDSGAEHGNAALSHPSAKKLNTSPLEKKLHDLSLDALTTTIINVLRARDRSSAEVMLERVSKEVLCDGA